MGRQQVEKIKDYLILGTVFLFPIIAANSFVDQVGLPKLIFLGFILCLLLAATAIHIYLSGKFEIAKGKFDLAVLVLVVAYLISALVATPNKMEAFFMPGNASIIIALGIFYFFLNTIANKDKDKLKIALILSAVTVSFILLAGFVGLFDKIPQLAGFVKSGIFNPTGDFITSSVFLAAVIPLIIIFLVKEKDIIKKLVFAFCLVFVLIGAGISIFTLLAPEKKASPLLPDFMTSWSVSVDSLKENPLLGVGAGNYLTAFNKFRPNSYNMTSLWQYRFSNSRDWFLTVISETGLLGVAGLLILAMSLIKMLDRNISIYRESRTLMIDVFGMLTLIALFVVLLMFPGTFTLLFLFFVFLAFNSQARVHTIHLSNESAAPRTLIALVLIGAILLFAFKSRPVILAEYKFKQASDALLANDGKKTYDLLGSAINLNPRVDKYHASYAQVNLAIARSIIASKKDAKDLTDDEKNTVLQLIQQAIREGQATVSLNPTRAGNWQVLANIYQVIIPFANQADQFALQSYSQTIALDPLDPTLRIAQGGIYYSLGKYDDAINAYQFAAYAKPDFANAYYNLSAAYAAKNDFDNAIAAMNKVLSLVPKDSSDYKQAQSDLDTLTKKQKTKETTVGSTSNNLTAPQKQTQTINPPLDLSKEASPPAAQATPAP